MQLLSAMRRMLVCCIHVSAFKKSLLEFQHKVSAWSHVSKGTATHSYAPNRAWYELLCTNGTTQSRRTHNPTILTNENVLI